MLQMTRNRLMGGRILALGLLTLALLAFSILFAAHPAHAATTFTVNSTADGEDANPGNGSCFTGEVLVIGDECTLRAAIQEANATSGADTIRFDIPTTGIASITPVSELPKITRPLTIDGYSQPGAEPNHKAVGSDAVLKIELSGANYPNGDGLVLGAANSTVKGLVVNRWNQGIRVDGSGATGDRISGNFIGTDASGTQKLGNYQGIRVYYGSETIIGGTTAAERNVISGNGHSGVSMGDGVVVEDTKVIGNLIGTDASGTRALGNSLYGLNIEDAPGTTIGGATTSARNVVSGNDQQGISIASNGVRVLGNFVGTDASGTKDLGNEDNGVRVSGANNVVGGTTAEARNVISGNAFSGVSIIGATSTGNKVTGNYLGTDKSGTKDLGNYHGVLVYDAPDNTIGGTTAAERNVASGNYYGVSIGGALGRSEALGNRVVGNYLGTDASGMNGLGNAIGVLVFDTPGNTIGGTTAGARNVISANTLDGVVVSGAYATGTRILSNSIYANAGLGIDLADDGLTTNDPYDPDTGPNNLQNFPVISSARTGGGMTTIRGTLDSLADKTYTVQFFSNPKGTDEGKKFIGQVRATTDGNGDASFRFTPQSKVDPGLNITATATSPGGSTSEFSTPWKVLAR